MAMFEFQPREPQQVAQKPLSSKITVDSDGGVKTNISIEDIPVIESDPRYEMLRPAVAAVRASFEKGMQVDNAAKQARIQELRSRMTEAAQVSTEAEIELAEAESEGAEDRPPFLGFLGKTPKQKSEQAKRRVQEIQKLLESDTPELSAPFGGTTSVEAAPTSAAPVRVPVAVTGQAPLAPTAGVPAPKVPNKETVKVRDPRGALGYYPKADWQRNSRQLMQQGYVLLP